MQLLPSCKELTQFSAAHQFPDFRSKLQELALKLSLEAWIEAARKLDLDFPRPELVGENTHAEVLPRRAEPQTSAGVQSGTGCCDGLIRQRWWHG
jgi:hypothetical protein